MRDFVFFFLNGRPVQVRGPQAFQTLTHWLRCESGLTGTKVACAQGACGACSVLVGRPQNDALHYTTVNACIQQVWQQDGAHLVTVEGLNAPGEQLTPVQAAMVECHGAQCGFCTPGFVVTLTQFYEREQPDLDDLTTVLTGNLCRCTGYAPIIEAGRSVDVARHQRLNALFPAADLRPELQAHAAQSSLLLDEERAVFLPATREEALDWKGRHSDAIVVAGGTEVGVQINEKGFEPRALLSLSNVPGLDAIHVKNQTLILGARATWTQVQHATRDVLPELSQFLNAWGSPQTRNAGTVAGSIVNASPISDALPFLLVCQTQIEMQSAHDTRVVPIKAWLQDGRPDGRPDVRPDELVTRVLMPLPTDNARLKLFKVSKRRGFDRSLVSMAAWLQLEGERLQTVRIACGGVAPVTVRLPKTEAFLNGQELDEGVWKRAGSMAQNEVAPISDAGASRGYRSLLVANLLQKLGREMRS